MSWRIEQGDCLDVLRGMTDASVDAVVCDPPYDLTQMTKRFGKPGSAPAQYGTDGVFQRSSRGFMGKEWDGTGIAFRVELWREVLRVLKPGGHLFAFGGTRTYHRMTCAIEDAGFEVRDCVQWLYGSGFPKSLDIGKAIDRAAGAEREVIGYGSNGMGRMNINNAAAGYRPSPYSDGKDGVPLTAPATPAAQQWDGWGTALKPAHEPIVLARKPIAGTVAANVQQYGTGALNIEAARVGTTDNLNGGTYSGGYHKGNTYGFTGKDGRKSPSRRCEPSDYQQPAGRWPANLVLSHAPGCNGVCVEGCPVRALGEQGGVRTSGTGAVKKATAAGWQGVALGKESRPVGTPNVEYGDTGTAARFFTQLEASPLDDVTPFLYTAKASRREREAGLEGMEEHDATDLTGRQADSPGLMRDSHGGLSGNPYKGSAPVVTKARNIHPTCKPVSIMRWLVKLITPPGGLVLDPFAGSGTTGIACVLDGFGFVGIEQDADYCEIARRRIAHWERQATRAEHGYE